MPGCSIHDDPEIRRIRAQGDRIRAAAHRDLDRYERRRMIWDCLVLGLGGRLALAIVLAVVLLTLWMALAVVTGSPWGAQG